MDSQLQQLRDAVKAVAKARAEGRPIDLSSLPPEIRQKIEAQLSRLPAETRQQLQGGVARAEQRVASSATVQRALHSPGVLPRYHGHYNNTIQRGDATHFPVMWIIAVLVGGLLLLKYVA